jgi:hypothetical protein
MSNSPSSGKPQLGEFFSAKASFVGYIVLNIPAVLMLVIFIAATIRRDLDVSSNGSAFTLIIAYSAIWTLWLNGFRLRILKGLVIYRNGFYKTHSLPLECVTKVEYKWVNWRFITRMIKVPRLIVHSGDSKFLLINPKPFSKNDLRGFQSICERVG